MGTSPAGGGGSSPSTLGGGGGGHAPRAHESLKDRQLLNELVTKVTRLLERQRARFRGTYQYLVTEGRFPDHPASLNSMPLALLEDLSRALVADDLAHRVVVQSTVVKGVGQTVAATLSAQQTLFSPDAAVLLLLRNGKLILRLAWYHLVWGILPFTALELEAVRIYHRGEPSPLVSSFLRQAASWDFRSPTGAPSLARHFYALKKFMAETTALEIPFAVKELLLTLGCRLELVGYGHNSA